MIAAPLRALAVTLTVVAAAFAAASPARAATDVVPDPPVAGFTWRPEVPTVGQSVAFISQSTSTFPWTLRDYQWDFDGDGIFEQSGTPVLYPGFATAGPHPVTLRVTDVRGEIAEVTQTVPVATGAPAPAAPVTTTTTVPVLTAAPAAAAPPPPTTLSPFPIVRLVGNYSAAGVRVRLLSVYAPQDATVAIRCAGRGCPYARRGPSSVRAPSGAGSGAAAPAHTLRVPGFTGRLLRPGVILRVLVMHPTRIGKYTRFRIRATGPPVRVDRCLSHEGRAVVACR